MHALTLLLALTATDLTPEKAAKVQKELDQAAAEVAKKYGNKKSSELTQDERRELIREQAAAETAVLDKHGVAPKDFARYEAKMNLPERAANKRAREELDKQELEAKRAAATSPGPAEVQVQRGFNDQNPVTLEEKASSGAPTVEKGLPPEAQADQAEASAANIGSTVPAPARKGAKK